MRCNKIQNVCTKIFFFSLLNLLSGDVLVTVAVVVCLISLIISFEENLEQLKVLIDDKLNLYFIPSSGDSKVSATSPLSPSELLVALHQIEAKSDMKSVMKGTLNLSAIGTLTVTGQFFWLLEGPPLARLT